MEGKNGLEPVLFLFSKNVCHLSHDALADVHLFRKFASMHTGAYQTKKEKKHWLLKNTQKGWNHSEVIDSQVFPQFRKFETFTCLRKYTQ